VGWATLVKHEERRLTADGGERPQAGETAAGPIRVYYSIGCTTDVPAESGWLSRRETEVLAGLSASSRRHDWLLGRWTAKQTVASLLEQEGHPRADTEIEIHAASDGAPELLIGEVASAWEISLSHRAGVALCALSRGSGSLGCDVEVVEPRSEELVADFFTDEERQLVRRSPREERDALIVLLWSAKESALKALREGLRLDTRSVTARPSDVGTEAGWRRLSVRCTEPPGELSGWWCRRDAFVLTVVSARPSLPPIEIGRGQGRQLCSTRA
jgi:4'-phosphopantetheinyl transferase